MDRDGIAVTETGKAADTPSASGTGTENPLRGADILKLPVLHLDGPLGSVRHSHSHGFLRRRLITLDIIALVVPWTVAALTGGLSAYGPNRPPTSQIVGVFCVAAASQWIAIVFQRLYLARVCSVRSIELTLLARSAAAGGLAGAIIADLASMQVPTLRLVLGACGSLLMLSLLRGMYGSWIRAGRASGQFLRPIILVGTNDEALGLMQLLQTHPELGLVVAGVVGDAAEHQSLGFDAPYLGGVEGTLEAVVATHGNGVLIAASALDPDSLNKVTREMLRHEVHVQLSSGLRGIDHRRIRVLPLAHEPLFYLERATLSRSQAFTKRTLDLVIASVVLLILSPALLAAAIAIKLNDGGPVFFRQSRVGRHGKQFTVFKLRTMVPDAEAKLDEVLEKLGNQRDSVLFKLERDPRRTKVGRILESTSFDEVPQLFNVLNGTMSLVGPRPALATEVAKFDDELLARLSVPPGVTGLWQVEARDNPSFSAYKRLDLFYVENWSLTLDLVLLVETFSSVVARMSRRRS